MDGVIGVVTTFAGETIPRNWLPCNGQQLQISSYQVLFDVIGNAFGGDGKTNFNLPDLRGRAPVSPGSNGSGTKYVFGQQFGSETLTITPGQLPEHTHTGDVTISMQASLADGIDPSPEHGFPSRFTGAYATTANATMEKPPNGFTVDPPGNQPVNICSPYLVLNYIICYAGIFPSRG